MKIDKPTPPLLWDDILDKMVEEFNEMYNRHTCALCGRATMYLYSHTWGDNKNIYFTLVCNDCKNNLTFLKNFDIIDMESEKGAN